MPSFWTLANNEPEGGVSVHFVDAKLDNGPIVVQRRYRIHAHDTLEDVMARSKDMAAEAIIDAVRLIEAGDPSLLPNPEEDSTALLGADARGRAPVPGHGHGLLSMKRLARHHARAVVRYRGLVPYRRDRGVEDPNRWPTVSLRSSSGGPLQILGLLRSSACERPSSFSVGRRALSELVRRIADDGHEIGTHSFWPARSTTSRPTSSSRICTIRSRCSSSIPAWRYAGSARRPFRSTPGTEWAF